MFFRLPNKFIYIYTLFALKYIDNILQKHVQYLKVCEILWFLRGLFYSNRRLDYGCIHVQNLEQTNAR